MDYNQNILAALLLPQKEVSGIDERRKDIRNETNLKGSGQATGFMKLFPIRKVGYFLAYGPQICKLTYCITNYIISETATPPLVDICPSPFFLCHLQEH